MKSPFIPLAVIVSLVLSGIATMAALRAPAPVEPSYGALSGPDIPSPYLQWGGVHEFRGENDMAGATTTPCYIQSPSGTSTLDYAAFRLSVASTSATRWDFARATSPYATTTAIGSVHLVAAGEQTTAFASTTGANGPSIVFPPNNYLVIGARGGISDGDGAVATGFQPRGWCQASFLVI